MAKDESILAGLKKMKNANWGKVFGNHERREETMEIKSRYEVIANLEEKKRDLIIERDSFDDRLRRMKKELRNSEREVADSKEDIKEFEGKIKDNKKTIEELIKGVDDSLKRLAGISNKK